MMLDAIVRAAPLVLFPFIALRSRRYPAWRPVALQVGAFAALIAVGPWTRDTRIDAATLALWPGIALAGAMAAMGSEREALRKGGWGRKSWRVSLACYVIAAVACAALYSRALWWIGSAIEMGLRVAVGPALVWARTARQNERPPANQGPSTTSLDPDAPVQERSQSRQERLTYHTITAAQVAALAPAIEIALAPIGPWARWLAGHAAVVEDWPLGLAGSAVAYAVVAIAMVVDVRRR